MPATAIGGEGIQIGVAYGVWGGVTVTAVLSAVI